jgi:hypothetical protein
MRTTERPSWNPVRRGNPLDSTLGTGASLTAANRQVLLASLGSFLFGFRNKDQSSKQAGTKPVGFRMAIGGVPCRRTGRNFTLFSPPKTTNSKVPEAVNNLGGWC